MKPMNLCALCREDFGSLELFDRHIVGKPGDAKRGCLTPVQMKMRGWRRDSRGRWADPERSDRARAAFRDSATVAREVVRPASDEVQ